MLVSLAQVLKRRPLQESRRTQVSRGSRLLGPPLAPANPGYLQTQRLDHKPSPPNLLPNRLSQTTNLVSVWSVDEKRGGSVGQALVRFHQFQNKYTWTKMQQYMYSGGKLFDPLLILYVCPLTNKLLVYNFNGRFIWTVRDRITTTKSRKTHFKKVIIWCAF